MREHRLTRKDMHQVKVQHCIVFASYSRCQHGRGFFFILVINQPDAQNLFYNKFISCLYMFRAPCAHRQEVKIVLYSLCYHHTYRCVRVLVYVCVCVCACVRAGVRVCGECVCWWYCFITWKVVCLYMVTAAITKTLKNFA